MLVKFDYYMRIRIILFSFLFIATVALLFFSCQKEVSFEYGTLAPGSDDSTAAFTLQGAPGVCMNDSVIGRYITGLVMNAGNYIMVGVDVTHPGTYTVSTNLVNGY